MERRWETVLLERDQGIGTITLNRPERLNALNLTMKRELPEAIAVALAEEAVEAIVITGAGRAFCSGADLKEMSPNQGPAYRRELRSMQSGLIESLALCEKPVVAAVNGPAVGGGMALAIACDLILASENAYFLAPQLPTVGVVPDLGLLHMLPRAVGAARARAMFLLGERLPASRAEGWGLVWEVLDPEHLPARAEELARQSARSAPGAVGAAKRLLADAGQGSLSQLLEAEASEVAMLRVSADHREAVAAFSERRRPRFRGE